jgi:glycosyltransferase involved in cell wall biosynthesis
MGYKKIILFYKRLISPGGAERLLLEEYKYLKLFGYDVKIVTYVFNADSLFDKNIDNNDVVIIGDGFFSIYKLSKYLSKQSNAHIISASGDIDIYLSTVLLRNINYSLHIHQPSFMTYSIDAKYSLFQKKYLHEMVENNFGAKNIIKINKNLKLAEKIILNIKAFFVIRATRKADFSFVMSKYAKEEKKMLFNIDSHVECGAIDDVRLDYSINNAMLYNEFSEYDNILLSVSRLDKNKRVDVAIRAFKIFLHNNNNSILLIIGTGPELQNLKDLSESLGVSEEVKFLGFVADNYLHDYYFISDLLIAIDWADYRITSFEALSVGTKVLMATEADYDNELKMGGYIFIAKAEPNSVCLEISHALSVNPSINNVQLSKVLTKYTWRNYTKRLIGIVEHTNNV